MAKATPTISIKLHARQVDTVCAVSSQLLLDSSSQMHHAELHWQAVSLVLGCRSTGAKCIILSCSCKHSGWIWAAGQ